MNIEINNFQKSFKNLEIDIKNYIIIVSIFISIILITICCIHKLEDYYFVKGEIKNKNISIIVSDLNKITDNKKIIINNKIFTYKIESIEDYIDNAYKIVNIDIGQNKDFLIENNIVDGKIVTKEMTVFKYLLKTIRGEWNIKEISCDELKNIDGGGLTILGVAGIIAGAVFVIGVIDGYVRPQKCN